MAGASGEHSGEAGVREQSSVAGVAGSISSAPETGVAGVGSPERVVYRPVSLVAIFAFALGVLYALSVLVGGLMPFSRAYPRLFVILLLLAPIGGILGAVLTRQKGVERYVVIALLSLCGVFVLTGLGGLVAFSSMAPWILPGPFWLLLGVAILLALIALSRIRGAEGALAGRDLARWGLWLSLFFGGYYLLYTFGSLFAVQNQAQSAADRFLEFVRKDEMPEAFAETLKPGSRPEGGAGLLKEIETIHDAPRSPAQPGEYTTFRNSDFIQRIRLGGDTKFTPVSSVAEYATDEKDKGYKATVTYLVTNDFGQFDLEVRLIAYDAGTGTRKWQVIGPSCRINRLREQSDLGPQIERAVNESHALSNVWLNALRAGKSEQAYLLTLPRSERLPLEMISMLDQPQTSAWAGLSPGAVLSSRAEATARLRKGVQEFRTGKILDSTSFMKGDLRRQMALRDISGLIAGTRAGIEARALPVQIPNAKRDGDSFDIALPVRFLISEEQGGPPRFAIEALVHTRGAFGDMRVTRLELLRAAIMEAQPQPGGGPPR